MKFPLILLTLTALSACGAPKPGFGPAAARLQASSVRAATGQLTYAREMHGFSSIQNPMRTMRLEYTPPAGQKTSLHAERFLNYAEFNIALTLDGNPNPDRGAQDFSSKQTGKVRALIDTLQNLDASAVQAADRESLGRICAHLKSVL